jgi:hypothetical protein
MSVRPVPITDRTYRLKRDLSVAANLTKLTSGGSVQTASASCYNLLFRDPIFYEIGTGYTATGEAAGSFRKSPRLGADA